MFDLGGISGGNAVFNPEKLDWFNQQHLLRLAPEELTARIQPLLEASGVWDAAFTATRRAWFFAVLELLRPRAKRLVEFPELGHYFFSDALVYDEGAVTKHLRAEGMREHLDAFSAALEGVETFDPATLESTLRSLADARGVKAGALIHAVRVAVTGRTVSPGIFEVLSLLGRARTQYRLAHTHTL